MNRAEVSLDAFLTSAGLQALEALRLFSQHGSFAAVGDVLQVDQRTVSRDLHNLNALFSKYSAGTNLLERPAGARAYALTTDGEALVEHLEQAAKHLRDAIRTTAAKVPTLAVPVTNNCLRMFKDLNDELSRRGSEVDLRPAPRRSADFPPIDSRARRGAPAPQTPPYAFYSAALPPNTAIVEGQVFSTLDDLEILCIKSEPFMLLADPRDFDTDRAGTVSIDAIFEGDATLMVPRGGAVWDFLDHARPGWYRLNKHVDATDLNCGLDCLNLKLTPHSVMVVHGFDANDPRIPNDYALHDLEANQGFRAITGLFRRPSMTETLRATERRHWEEVWRVAVDYWTEGRQSA